MFNSIFSSHIYRINSK